MTSTVPERGLAALRASCPWPAEPPKLEPDYSGWFNPGHHTALYPYVVDAKCILELGVWLGRSLRWFLHTCPQAVGIAVDHWQGSAEHRRDPSLALKLAQLWDLFLVTNWVFRERIYPVKADTITGMQQVAAARVPVDFVYVDAAHEPSERVLLDITTACELFPKAKIAGDDWPHKPVQQAVEEFVQKSGRRLRQKNRVWVTY